MESEDSLNESCTILFASQEEEEVREEVVNLPTGRIRVFGAEPRGRSSFRYLRLEVDGTVSTAAGGRKRRWISHPVPAGKPVILHGLEVRLSSLSTKSLQSSLREVCGTDAFEFSALQGGDLLVSSPSVDVSDLLISCHALGQHSVSASYPATLRGPKGSVRGISADITPSEFLNELSADGVSACRFLCGRHHFANGEFTPNHTHTFVLEFSSEILPDKVKAFHRVFRVERFKEKPIQCKKCFRSGHGARSCKFSPRCGKCGGKHDFRECSNLVLPEKPVCIVCSGGHLATSSLCPVRARAVAVFRTASRDCLSYSDAVKRVSRFTSVPDSSRVPPVRKQSLIWRPPLAVSPPTIDKSTSTEDQFPTLTVDKYTSTADLLSLSSSAINTEEWYPAASPIDSTHQELWWRTGAETIGSEDLPQLITYAYAYLQTLTAVYTPDRFRGDWLRLLYLPVPELRVYIDPPPSSAHPLGLDYLPGGNTQQ